MSNTFTMIRPYQSTFDAALSRICCLTADAGSDATGQLSDDAIWGNIFILPYVARHPQLAWIIQLPPESHSNSSSGDPAYVESKEDEEDGTVISVVHPIHHYSKNGLGNHGGRDLHLVGQSMLPMQTLEA